MNIIEDYPAEMHKTWPTSQLSEEDIKEMGDAEFWKLLIKLLINKKHIQKFKEFKEYLRIIKENVTQANATHFY